MNTLFMNSKNSKTSDLIIDYYSIFQNLRKIDKYVDLLNLSMHVKRYQKFIQKQ